ncbi:SAM-dependent methyltransferase [Paraburkholderia terricola]|uniref:class I SAM-dependent methyltransferase n=1 Tax=Paraburkholderia terricola TaxID=169427 RepID=UPI00285F1EBE|nr:class I SAM-dependent methyltransferase [Paraburkholderia terricola]MDR6496385.1 SAM-dependent methyltransferase [Paraburkholderia terricola]
MANTYASTKHFYDHNAESYAEATRLLPMSDAIDAFIEQLPQGLNLADLGCGAGRDLLTFSQRGLTAIGLDISPPLAKLANSYSQCPVIVGDIRALPFGTAVLGGAWASASLLHLQRSDVDFALNEVRRILSHRGVFFSSIKCGQGEEMDAKGRWFSYFEPTDWLLHLRNAGFSVVDTHRSVQASATVEKDRSVAWFSCIARRTG